MPDNYSITVSLEDLGMTYRKVKVDLYYTSLPVKENLVTYKTDLVENIKNLKDKLEEVYSNWFKSEPFRGVGLWIQRV